MCIVHLLYSSSIHSQYPERVIQLTEPCIYTQCPEKSLQYFWNNLKNQNALCNIIFALIIVKSTLSKICPTR